MTISHNKQIPMMKTHLLIYLCLIPLMGYSQAFDLGDDQNLLQEPFSISGNIGFNFRTYRAWNIENRQYPYTTTITANFTIKSYAVTIPFSFVMHNLDESDRPFDKEYWDGFFTNQRNRLMRIGASPSYRSITVHLGYRYMNLSQFTFANHNFLGAGIDLKPEKGKLRLSAMGGRLTKAEPESISLNTQNVQQYTRIGWGFKLGYFHTTKDYLEFALFSAADDPKSLQYQSDSPFLVTPQENLAISLAGKKSLGENLSFQFEIAKSALTRNAKDPDDQKGFGLYNSFIFQRKSSTSFNNAAELKMEYQKREILVGLSYRRIDPGYKSLGAYFFNDDLEDITAYTRFKIFKKKVDLYVTGGIRRNNLEKEKDASFKRIIGSANLTYRLEDWTFTATVSNYSSKVDYQLNPDLDSLNAVIVSQEASIIVNKVFPGNGGSFQSINFITGLQTVNDMVDNPEQSVASDLFFINASYTIATRTSWQYSLIGDLNTNSLFGLKLNRYGAGVQIAKGFKNNKYQVGVGMNYYLQTSTEGLRNHLWSNFVRGTWQVTKQQTVNVQVNWLRNLRSNVGIQDDFSELMGSIGYNMRFGYSSSRNARVNKSNTL